MRKYFILLVLLISISIDVSCAELTFLSETVLEETEEVFFKFINNADISPDSKKIVLLPSYENESIYLYDAETMNLIQEIKADNSLINPILHKVEHYEKNHTIVPHNFNEHYKQLANLISVAKFIDNDELKLMHKMHFYSIDNTKNDIHSPKHVFMNMLTAIWHYKLSTGKFDEGIVFNNQRLNDSVFVFAQNNLMINIGENYYLTSTSPESNASIGKYDKDGRLISIVHDYPEDFSHHHYINMLNYDVLSTTNDNDEFLAAYTLSDKIYNISKGTHFKLKAKFDNTDFFDKVIKDSTYLDMMADTLWKQAKLKVRGVYSSKSNHTLVYIQYVYTQDDVFHEESFLQIYDENNKFVQEFDIQYENAKGKLYYALFDKNTNRFFFFRKNKENWIVEKYKLEI